MATNDASHDRHYRITSISNNDAMADVIHAHYYSGHSNNIATWWRQQSGTAIMPFGVPIISGKL